VVVRTLGIVRMGFNPPPSQPEGATAYHLVKDCLVLVSIHAPPNRKERLFCSLI